MRRDCDQCFDSDNTKKNKCYLKVVLAFLSNKRWKKAIGKYVLLLDAITFNELYSSNSLTVLHWCQNDNKTTKRERWIHNGVAVAIPVRAVRNSLRKLIRLSTRNIWNWNWNALLIWPRGIRLLAWLLESTIQQGLKRWTYRQKDIACQIFSRVAIRLLQRGWWSLTVVSEPAIDISYDFYRRTSVAN